jgi:hypothetical protein
MILRAFDRILGLHVGSLEELLNVVSLFRDGDGGLGVSRHFGSSL